MKEVIKFKAGYLNKLLGIYLSLSLLISVLIILRLDVDFIDGYIISMTITLSGLMVVFYLNKYEVEEIILTNENLEFYFINKFIFRRKTLNCLKSEINVKINQDIILIYKDSRLIAKVRKNSININSWEFLINYVKEVNV